MSVKQFKIKSEESGVFDDNGSVVHLTIPQSFGKVDLKKSWINFYANLTVAGAPVGARYNCGLYNENARLPQSALVKHVRVEGGRVGELEDIKDVHKLSATLDHYTMDNEEKKNRMLPQWSDDITKASWFLNRTREGTESSQYRRFPLRVNLSDLKLGLAKDLDVVDLSKTGDLKFWLELNKNIFDVNEQIHFTTSYTTAIAGLDVPAPAGDSDLDYVNFDPSVIAEVPEDVWFNGMGVHITGTSSAGGGTAVNALAVIKAFKLNRGDSASAFYFDEPFYTLPGGETLTAITVVPSQFNPVINTDVNPVNLPNNQIIYSRLTSVNESPFWVGQRLSLDFSYYLNATSVANGDDLGEYCTVSGIDFDTGRITLTLDLDGGPVAIPASSYALISVESLTPNDDSATIDWELDEIEMNILAGELQSDDGDVMSYNTWISKPFNIPANTTSTFNYVEHLNENCVNAIVMTPNQYLISNRGNTEEWRLRINRDDNYNRNITLSGNDLYFDSVYKTLLNMPTYPLKHLLRLQVRPRDWNRTQTDQLNNASDIVMFGTPVPMNGEPKLFRITLQPSTGNALPTEAIIFEQVVKEVQL